MKNQQWNKYKDNPNPKANIGFMCYVPLNFWVYKNIYKHLPNSEFIVGDRYDSKEYDSKYMSMENILDFFSKQNVYWRFNNPNDDKITKKEFYNKYALLVSTWYRGAVERAYNHDKKLVRVMYGHAKDIWNFGPWSAYFDAVLSYGEYSQKFLSIYGNSTIVGNPKFDDWFSGSIDMEETEKIKKMLDPSKKTILYVPTLGEISSLSMMVSALYSAANRFNIIVKPHHNSLLYEKHFVEPYAKSDKILVISDKLDMLPVYKIADYVISDNSGAIFDAILADKPLILIDFIDDTFFERHKENLFISFDKTHSGALTTKNSIEQTIKQPGKEIGVIIKINKKSNQEKIIRKPGFQISYEELEKSISILINDEEKFSARRKAIVQEAFSFNDGLCGQRAAQKILEILHKPKAGRTFMAEALDKYFDYFITKRTGVNKSNFWHSRRGREEAAKRYLKIKSLPFSEKITVILNEFFNQDKYD